MRRIASTFVLPSPSAWLGLLLALVSLAPLAAFAQARPVPQLRVAPEPSGPRPIDQIVAVVNNEVITRNELRNRVRATEAQLTAQKMQLPAPEVLERQVLERMIVERAQMQAARGAGLRVDDVQLDRAIARIAEQNKMSVQQFRDRLEAEGTPFVRFREEVRDEIMLQRLREREVDSRVQVSENEIDNYLADQKVVSSNEPEELNIAQILVRVPEQANADQIEERRKRGEEVLRQLAAGADFAQLAATYSDAAEALAGGELGWRPTDRLPQIFVEAVANVKVGEVAPMIKSANGFHVLKVVGRRVGGAPALNDPVKQTRVRHILMRVTELVPSQQARQRLSDIRQRIENKTTTFEDMARQYSADASGSRGGEIGVVLPGDTVPEFERAMDALAPGEISDPVETPFGWHLIQVLERKTEELPRDRQRLVARQALRERKIEEAFQDWLRQTRDRAYVDIRLDER